MLWMKAWLETRWRLAHIFGIVVLAFIMAASGGGLGSAEHAGNLMRVLSFLSIFADVNLAGAGIRTQSPVRAGRGLHGSTYFTLSLPVSRFRLLTMRVAFGFLETTAVNVFMIVSAWVLFPLVRQNSTAIDLLRLVFAAIVCTSCFYFASTSLAALLDEMWQIYGSVFVIGIAWWVVFRLGLPASANIFGFTNEASPLLTHALPWPAMAISLVFSGALFLVALKIVQAHEY